MKPFLLSLFSLALLPLTVRSQVVYVNPEPDFALSNVMTSSMQLDLDSDGVYEFNPNVSVLHYSNNMYDAFTFFNTMGDTNNQVMVVAPQAGYAPPLSIGDTIDPQGYWDNGGASRSIACDRNYTGDYFLGVRFVNASGLHYGWVRVHTWWANNSPVNGMIIYDWAYEVQPDSSIIVGEGWNDVHENQQLQVGISVVQHTLLLFSEDANVMCVSIFNALGQPVCKKENLRGNSSVELPDVAPGIYFVEVEENGKLLTKKVLLN